MAKMRTYRIEAKSDDKYKVTVTSGDRTFYVDQPLFAGGTDAGASPMEYLYSSLAGCIATTARIIATQKKLSLNGMDIKIDGSLDLDVIYGKSGDSRPGVTGINVNLALDSEMSEVERKSFLEELHSRCPVLDTIAAVTPTTLTAG
ncbi:MAG: OsmC family protein [Geobacter sp.]|nr:OsmC family protein [Geobacter sp.]